jgi:ADP-ribose pyrophosphatase
MIQPWKKLHTREAGDFRIFDITVDRKVNPRNGHEQDFYVINAPNWVNVVATTSDGRMILVEQFRHGSGTVELEIPGGVMDPHDTSPVEAAVRELREETGYEGRDARVIGRVFSNPAIMVNTTFTVLVEDCERKLEIELDAGEDLVTCVKPIEEVRALAAAGKIGHSLVMAALYHYELTRS